jgi:hypothetical protein
MDYDFLDSWNADCFDDQEWVMIFLDSWNADCLDDEEFIMIICIQKKILFV